MMCWWWGQAGWWSMGPLWAVMALFWLVVLLGAAAVVFWLVLGTSRRSMGHGMGFRPVQETPEEILRRRFAAGEIDENEFRRRQDTLRQDGPPSEGGV